MLDTRDAGIKLYPRGFVGSRLPIRLAVKPKPYEIKIRSAIQVGIVQPQQVTADPNHVVETLYAQYLKRSADTLSFEFREAVLIATLNAFGYPNFYTWYMVQLQSPALGDMHMRFLADTLGFLMTGRREMRLETWAHLIKCNDEVLRPIAPCATAKKYFMMENRAVPADTELFTLENTIQLWCEKPQGIEDLLGTLHLLFGNL
jgi:hypothetical protein